MKRIILPLLILTAGGFGHAQYYDGPYAAESSVPAAAEEITTEELAVTNEPAAEAAPSDAPDTTLQEPVGGLPAAEELLPAEEPLDAGPIIADPAMEENYFYDGEEYIEDKAPPPLQARPENYPDIDPNKVKGVIIQLPFTNITLTPPYAPYQTYDTSRLKSGRIPEMSSSQSLLQNLHKTSWRLKFYGHPDIDSVDSVLLDINEPQIMISTSPKKDTAVSGKLQLPLENPVREAASATYRLTLVKSLRPGEGIYAYDNGRGAISFMYIRLIMPHLLAFDMAASYDEIAKCPDKSLTDLGVFTLE